MNEAELDVDMGAAADLTFRVAQRVLEGAPIEAMRVTRDADAILLEIYPSHAPAATRLWLTPQFVYNEGDQLERWIERKVSELRDAWVTA